MIHVSSDSNTAALLKYRDTAQSYSTTLELQIHTLKIIHLLDGVFDVHSHMRRPNDCLWIALMIAYNKHIINHANNKEYLSINSQHVLECMHVLMCAYQESGHMHNLKKIILRIIMYVK